jgi:DNA-binding MarR family transcriptional regulator
MNKQLLRANRAYDPDQRIAYRFTLMASWQTRCLAAMYMRKFKLSVTGWWVMAIIGRYAKTSATNIVERTTLAPDKITRTVDSLVKAGYVLRREDLDDRRRLALTLTAKGRRVFEEIEDVCRILEFEFLSVLDPRELESLYAILDKLERRGREIFLGEGAWRTIVASHKARVSAAKAYIQERAQVSSANAPRRMATKSAAYSR